jgi:hypothetical protein
MEAIHQTDLPSVGSSYEFVGARTGGLGISMFVVIAEIGRGPVVLQVSNGDKFVAERLSCVLRLPSRKGCR